MRMVRLSTVGICEPALEGESFDMLAKVDGWVEDLDAATFATVIFLAGRAADSERGRVLICSVWNFDTLGCRDHSIGKYFWKS